MTRLWWSAEVDLYTGAVDAAQARLERDERRLAHSQLLRIPYIRVTTAYLRARVDIAALSRAPSARARAASRAIAAMEREDKPWAAVLAAMAAASLDAVKGEAESAIARLRGAISAAEQCHMSAHADVSRLRLGALLGGEEGQELSSIAMRRLVKHGVVAPRSFASSFFTEAW